MWPELIDSVEKYVIDNLDIDLSLNAVAEAFRVSPQHLSKIFKEEKGMNYIECVARHKIEKAKQLLSNTGLSIDEITNNIGYSHATYFSRKFKELTGCTPSEYRSRESKRKNS